MNKDIRLKEAVKSGITFDGSQVLYGKLRPYLHNWLNPDFKGIAVGDWWVLKPINMEKNFLYRLIQTQQFDNIANQSSGSKMPRADWNLISNSQFVVPFSKEEQSKIGGYFDNIDHLITLHQRKYLQEKKTSLTWEQRKLSELASMHARIGWQNLRTSEFLDVGDYMLITGTDFEDGKVNYSTCHYVEKERYDQDKNIQIKNGSILITKDGTLGKVAYVEGLSMPATLNAGVFNVEIKNKNETDGRYLFQFLKAPFLMDYVAQKATGGTIKHLNQNILVDFPISSPSKEEQTKIGEYFSSIDHLITLHRRAHFHRRRRTYK
ncbi:MAG: restriction endonuclease subunit S [Coprococcus sp.]